MGGWPVHADDATVQTATFCLQVPIKLTTHRLGHNANGFRGEMTFFKTKYRRGGKRARICYYRVLRLHMVLYIKKKISNVVIH